VTASGTHAQFLRYAAVGLTSNILLYLTYLALTRIGVGHKTAMTGLYVISVLITFLANRNWTFQHRGAAQTTLIRYLTAYAVGYLLNFVLLWLAADRMGLPHQLVQFVAIFLVAVSLFLMQKYWVFLPSSKGSAP